MILTSYLCVGVHCRKSNELSSEVARISIVTLWIKAVAYRGGWFVGFKSTPKFQSYDKTEPNSHSHGKYIRSNLLRIRGSLIYRLSGTPD
jgi:hypothetical protein